LKYAFPGDSTGTLKVTLKRAGEKRIELSVEDDGAGMPASVNIDDPRSFGLSLVNLLVRQVQGTRTFSSDSGTRYAIVFEI
jgi:two-component sensor histidine kinase